jgi:PAT family beta-lactamase induction signal transducer AmpG
MLAGLPLSLTASTLTTMLADYGLDLSMIGLFALVGLPYSLKFVWSPLVDSMSIPVLHRMFGRRRSWLILLILLLALFIFSISLLNPLTNLALLAVIIFSLAAISATYDIVFDAFRIELLTEKEQAAGASVYVLGYRIGMLISSAGALYIAHFFKWQIAYLTMSLCCISGIFITLMLNEPKGSKPLINKPVKSILLTLMHAYTNPIKEFFNRVNAIKVLIFVTLFKLGDAYAGMMTTPFLITIGFSKLEIANIVKGVGLIATFAGIFFGGYFASRVSMAKAVVFALIAQIASNLLFIIQVHAGHDNYVLTAVICAENFAGGIGTSILLAYLANLCNIRFTATQFALLSSFATIGRSTISGSAGFIADTYGWTAFFIISAMLSVPALFLTKSQFKVKKSIPKNIEENALIGIT